MKTTYILTIYHETRDTQAFYASREQAMQAVYTLISHNKPVVLYCIVYDSNNEILKKTRVY